MGGRVIPRLISEKEVQQRIRTFLRDVVGLAVYNLSQPRASKQTEGLPDLIALGRGHALFVEVKSPVGRQTEAQKRFEGYVADTPAEYVCWRSVGQAKDWAIENGLIEEV